MKHIFSLIELKEIAVGYSRSFKSRAPYRLSSLLACILFCLLTQSAFAEHSAPVQASLDKLKIQVEQVVTDLSKQNTQVRVSERIDRVGPSLILKMNQPLLGETAEQRVSSFIAQYASMWGRVHLTIEEIQKRSGRTVATLNGSIDGLMILGQQSRLSIKDGRAQHLSNGIGALSVLKRATINEDQARASVFKAIRDRTKNITSIRRVALPFEPGVALEAFELRLVDASKMRTWVALVDGRDGVLIQVRAGELH